jgi:hypothetical protein
MTVSAGPLQQEFILVNISCRNGKLQQFEKKKKCYDDERVYKSHPKRSL